MTSSTRKRTRETVSLLRTRYISAW